MNCVIQRRHNPIRGRHLVSRTHRVRAVDALGLFAERELLLAAEHLVDALAVEDGDLRPELLQFLQQDASAWSVKTRLVSPRSTRNFVAVLEPYPLGFPSW